MIQTRPTGYFVVLFVLWRNVEGSPLFRSLPSTLRLTNFLSHNRTKSSNEEQQLIQLYVSNLRLSHPPDATEFLLVCQQFIRSLQEKIQKMIAEVASMNKRGIECLRTGRHAAAIICFIQAMEHARQCCVHDFATDANQTEAKARQCGYPLRSEVAATNVGVAAKVADADVNLFEMYTRPFVIEDSILVPPSVVAVALSFNIGLGYHLQGLSCNISDDLRLALRFYERGLCILRQNAVEGYSSNGMYWLALAHLNNSGSILWRSWNMQEALNCREHMKSLVEREQVFTLPTWEIHFFVDCSTSALYIIRSAAPAA